MKKILMAILYLLFCIVVVSCSHQMEHSETTGQRILNEETKNDSAENQTDKEEITILEKESHQEPPTVLVFSSIYEMEDFIIASQGTKESFYQYVDSHNQYALNVLSYETLLKISANIQSCELPVLKEDVTITDFGASYTEDRSELDMVYIMEGIRYRFTYRFNYNKIHTNDSFPVVEGVKMGDGEVDIYQNDYSFYTTYLQGTTTVFVNIFAGNVSDVSFDCFDIEPLVSK